ncbi:MAG: ATP-binding protein [Xanthomonadaceae bacterium]|jgi:predicted kinase|nr:ATP-binding protein [Xanthomonadaceae bacterium]
MPSTGRVLVGVVGLPGAGKSTLVARLQQSFGLRRVCRDAIRRAMFPDCRWSPTEKRAAFRASLLAAEVNLALGCSTVFDGMTLARERERDKAAAVARAAGARWVVLWLDLPAALARARIAADRDAHPAGDRTPELVDAVAERFEPPSGAAWIDAALDADAVLAQAHAVVQEAITRDA